MSTRILLGAGGRVLYRCACGVEYSTTTDGGTRQACAKCHARAKRGGLKQAPDESRGKRTVAMQVWWTAQEWARLTAAEPNALKRAAWLRELVRAELDVRDLREGMRR